jgi:hypothetical protein
MYLNQRIAFDTKFSRLDRLISLLMLVVILISGYFMLLDNTSIFSSFTNIHTNSRQSMNSNISKIVIKSTISKAMIATPSATNQVHNDANNQTTNKLASF